VHGFLHAIFIYNFTLHYIIDVTLQVSYVVTLYMYIDIECTERATVNESCEGCVQHLCNSRGDHTAEERLPTETLAPE